MFERSQETKSIRAALLKAWTSMQNPKKTSVNSAFKSKYATLNDYLDEVVPKLKENGILLFQSMEKPENEFIGIKTILEHAASGEWYSSIYYAPKPSSTMKTKYGEEVGKNMDQAMGSLTSYARRYGLAAMLGLGADDDDGEAAGSSYQDFKQERSAFVKGSVTNEPSPFIPTSETKTIKEKLPWGEVGIVHGKHKGKRVKDLNEVEIRWFFSNWDSEKNLNINNIDLKNALSEAVDHYNSLPKV